MKARITAHREYRIAEIDDRVYGSFLEHLGRAVYTGIYEPGHKTADKNGMRGDVIELVRELNTPVCRYPGGNFVSAYDWKDGIGPKSERPTRLDLAWHTSESNEVGIHEFADWCEAANTKPMLAVNLGSRGLQEAREFVEYVNHPGGSALSDLRKKNGRAEPWDVKLWCLGNEMDGPWQIGSKTADEYGRLASETAKAIRAFDKSLELIVCGSSFSGMPTFPQWEATVLEHTYNEIDHISLHMYFRNPEKNTANYLALNAKLDDYIHTVGGVIDFIKAKKRSKKQVTISFDEWNVWYHSNKQDRAILDGNEWPLAPRLLEDIYNFEDVLQVGLVLNTFIRRADRVKIACIAQLVNVIAPIMTEPGGPAWRQTIYYPFLFASKYGRGTSMALSVHCPGYDVEYAGDVQYLDVSSVLDEEANILTFFIVNRHETEAIDASFDLASFGKGQVVHHEMIRHDDLEATNTMDNPMNVAPEKGSGSAIDGTELTLKVPALSYHVLRVKL